MARQAPTQITINRAPVLTFWAAVVAERLGFDWAEALTMGRAVAGLDAYAKGKALGIFHPKPAEVKEKHKALKHGEQLSVNLLERAVPVVRTAEGFARSRRIVRLPRSVERYLESKLGAGYEPARRAMTTLASSFRAEDLAERAYGLYEDFRPEVPAGRRGRSARSGSRHSTR